MTSRFRKLPSFQDQHAVIRKAWLHDSSLSFAARGILGAVAALEPGTYVDTQAIADMSTDSVDMVESALRELTDAGYLTFGDVPGDLFLDDPHPPVQQTSVPANTCQPPTFNPDVRPPRYSGRQKHASVVYYLRRESGDIKVGFSERLHARRGELEEEHGPLDLLGTEPGGWYREHELHQQFAAHRVRPDREWFRPGPALLQHIAGLSQAEVSA